MPDPLAFQGLRVLVVEDDMMVSMLLEDMLAGLGCLVAGPASSLDEAMVMADSQDFDCALLDVNLAGQQSFPLADRLLELKTPFSYATGYGEAGLRPKDKGAIVLMKPFRESDLVRVLGDMRDRLKTLGD